MARLHSILEFQNRWKMHQKKNTKRKQVNIFGLQFQSKGKTDQNEKKKRKRKERAKQ